MYQQVSTLLFVLAITGATAVIVSALIKHLLIHLLYRK
jgi:hypothetical protein